MALDAALTIVRDATAESGKIIPAGSIVRYCGHVVGGMVRVEHNGHREVIHPYTTKELRP